VALGGDGGDELLAGYPTFAAERAARWYRLPRVVHDRVVVPLAGRLPVSTDNFSFDFKVKRFLRGVPYDAATRHQVWLGAFGPDEQDHLLRDRAAGGDPYADVLAAEHECTSRDPLERLIYSYCRFYLQDDILTKVDRASMACSLEVRAPFLDYTLVEYLATIPPDLKLRGFHGKYILKRAMGERLPPGIATRGKKGFGIPVAKWFRGELRDILHDTLAAPRLQRQGIFDPATVQRLLSEHDRGTHDHRKQLWTLFMFQLWSDRYARAPQPVTT
jgi:asparagine synthase (glutamine-hydrolysing)